MRIFRIIYLCVFRDAFFVDCEFIGKNSVKMRTALMENRVAIISMIIDNEEIIPEVNRLLHEYGRYILSRMGLPYRERALNIICVVADAPADVISALSGKLGRLQGVTSKAVYSKQTDQKTKEG